MLNSGKKFRAFRGKKTDFHLVSLLYHKKSKLIYNYYNLYKI